MSEDKPTPGGAARPTGKRQLTGVSTTSTADYEKKQPRPVAEAAEPTSSKANAVVSFLPEVGSEMKKVIWPTSRQMVNYTLIVFAFLIALTALVAGVDFLAGLGVEKVLTHR
ncbi:preprotein translocase subunit SecE [Corynebacterium sp. ES2794-CONJ1]|uniref:preprotein translocase subunit SecE n=1 Tax=unclassified Corynebacterium TaxID=2624378 RepID=UPI0021695635|nr:MULTISPECIES: preprotein translocase subunit SecE [unclassified Corynebacterium]MCS4489693.1 preprotein translocase subunit SecE [Corynebacterium sp. ES2775-CONJ]MCS4491298.1 preprotein translocase subunit SecE [Corynebacterium sp. ES2715-CONJ3]MCS4531605.1 preprotein translocase subunit SecE [Corynebacterium sp. ES2730-CONJ]MCU9519001.1 preprotein translocase subunit SecE [Corynebacterium sp. ES2794-CONJ1]